MKKISLQNDAKCQEQNKILIGRRRVHAQCNNIKPESTTFFHNFVRVFQGLLSTIVAQPLPTPLAIGAGVLLEIYDKES